MWTPRSSWKLSGTLGHCTGAHKAVWARSGGRGARATGIRFSGAPCEAWHVLWQSASLALEEVDVS